MKPEDEVKLNSEWEVSKKYWVGERQFTEQEYEQVIRNCAQSNFGSCDHYMGYMNCEIKIKGTFKIDGE